MKSQQKQELDGIIDKIIGYFRFHDRKERDDETTQCTACLIVEI